MLRRSMDGGSALLRGLGGDLPRRAVDTDALVRREYWKRIATQVFQANTASTLHYCGGSVLLALTVGSPLRWTPLQLQKLLCGLLSLGLLVLCMLQRVNSSLPVRWRSEPEAIIKRLITLEIITYAVINISGLYEYSACWYCGPFARADQRALSIRSESAAELPGACDVRGLQPALFVHFPPGYHAEVDHLADHRPRDLYA